MADHSLQKLAQVIVHYSLKLKPDDTFIIRAPEIAAPLIREVYREAIRAGAYVNTEIELDGLREIFFKESNEKQLTHVSEYDKLGNEYFNAALIIWAPSNSRALSRINPQRIARHREATSPLLNRTMAREAEGTYRWCGTLFPTQALAQDFGMSLSEYEAFLYEACLLNDENPITSWQKVYEKQQHVADFLMQHDEIHIVAPDTDLTYRTAGRQWINCAGINIPDGEVFSGPIEDSVTGRVRFTYPAQYEDNEVEDVSLTFQDGKVIESAANRGLDFLNAMLDTDSGSRYVGEVAFGLNYHIKEFTKHRLLDEKIGGTMHMALGASIPMTGGVNRSGLHWDLVCDLREGQVYADGQLCYEHGNFII
ncbi:aminopeptidase [Ktedonobacteria bacterium brp13]|nr:aminopeptidase [Ktedonobacteria bacterium brp13]